MCSLVLVTVAPLVSALTINPPTSVTSGGTINFSWLTAPGDPYVNQTFTPFPLTIFLGPFVTSPCSTQKRIFSTSFPRTLTYPWVLLVCSARMFLLGMLYIVVCLCFVSEPPFSDSYNIVAATNKNIAESAAFSIGEVNSSSTSTAVSATGTNTNTLTLY